MLVAPSILAANFNNLLEEVLSVDFCNADFLHCDIMDGHFVPNISFGATVIKYLKGYTDMVFDVHLMISDPLKYASDFCEAGADIITFHYEAVDNIKNIIEKIRDLNVKVGISIKPNTPVEVLKPYLPLLDLVLIMSVEPGFGGQKFMENSLEKIKTLADLKKENNYNYLIEVDGGINYDTAKLCQAAGCEVVVAGTYIFKETFEKRKEIIKGLKEL